MSGPLPPVMESPLRSIDSEQLHAARTALRDAANAVNQVSSRHKMTGITASDRQHFNGAAALESEHMISQAVTRAESAAALFNRVGSILLSFENELTELAVQFRPAYETWMQSEDPQKHLEAQKRLEAIRDARVKSEEKFASSLRKLSPPKRGDLLDLALQVTPSSSVKPAFTMSPSEFAKALQKMTPHEREKFAREHRQDIMKYILDKGRDSGPTREISAWWKGLSPQERTEMMRTIPEFIGNANGIPYADRNQANRLMLKYLADGRRKPAPGQEGAVKQFSEALAAQDQYVIGDKDLKNQLISLDASGRLLAQVSIGDLDQATTFAFLEHGIANGTDRNPESWLKAGAAFSNGLVRKGNGKAVIASFGYDAPDGAPFLDPGDPRFPLPGPKWSIPGAMSSWVHGDLSVLHSDHAENGAPAMAARYDAARVFADLQHPDDKIRITVMAHSYGTRAQAYALTLVKHRVDAAYWAGSAGVPAGPDHRVTDLKVGRDGGNPGDHVFAYTNSDDWTARLAGIRGSQSFGLNQVVDPSSVAFPTSPSPEPWVRYLSLDLRQINPKRSLLGNTVLRNPDNPMDTDFTDALPSHDHDASTEGSGKDYPGYFDRTSYSGKYARWVFEGNEDKINQYVRK